LCLLDFQSRRESHRRWSIPSSAEAPVPRRQTVADAVGGFNPVGPIFAKIWLPGVILRILPYDFSDFVDTTGQIL
jgi:hypothetical protein